MISAFHNDNLMAGLGVDVDVYVKVWMVECKCMEKQRLLRQQKLWSWCNAKCRCSEGRSNYEVAAETCEDQRWRGKERGAVLNALNALPIFFSKQLHQMHVPKTRTKYTVHRLIQPSE